MWPHPSAPIGTICQVGGSEAGGQSGDCDRQHLERRQKGATAALVRGHGHITDDR